jgi:hypothetical protein
VAPREAGDDRLRWDSQLEVDLPTLAARVRDDCRAGALMQFVRAPYLASLEGRVVLGDLRFDRGVGPGFAELEWPEPEAPCPRPVPWEPPRARELVGAGR